jgi:hypothetical protein
MNDLTMQAPFVTLHESDRHERSGECEAKRFSQREGFSQMQVIERKKE